MLSSIKSYIQKEIQLIREKGLYKDERIIISPQNANITTIFVFQYRSSQYC